MGDWQRSRRENALQKGCLAWAEIIAVVVFVFDAVVIAVVAIVAAIIVNIFVSGDVAVFIFDITFCFLEVVFDGFIIFTINFNPSVW